jgi:multidrug efflux pump subunit AcrB
MLYTSYTPNMPQLQLNVDVDKAMAQGVPVADVYEAIASYFAQSYVNDFNKYGRVYRVYMQADSEYRETLADLDKVYVKNMYGKMVPLMSVISTQNIVGPYIRTRFNMYPSITINGSTRAGVSSGKAMQTMEKISEKVLPEDMTFSWSGSSLQEKQSSGQIAPILLMSLVFIFLFLVGLYESWLLPISVLLVTPVALVGALLFQYVSGYDLDLYSQIGLVMLIGLSTKQAILIIEFAKDAHESGLSIRESALQAAKLRFRAVMMTNIAFILGLLPLVFASGAGAASRHSIGVTVIGGMIAVAFVGTFLVPSFYVMVEEFKLNFAKKVKEIRERKHNA